MPYSKLHNPYTIDINPVLSDAQLNNISDNMDTAQKIIRALTLKIPVQSIIYTATANDINRSILLSQIWDFATDNDIVCLHIDNTNKNDFMQQIHDCCLGYIENIQSVINATPGIDTNALDDALKSFTLLIAPDKALYSPSLQQDQDLYLIAANPTQILTDVFVDLGNIANDIGIPICIFIDDMDRIAHKDLSALITSLHRVTQLNLPIMLIGSGLPTLHTTLAHAKSYSERLFIYLT